MAYTFVYKGNIFFNNVPLVKTKKMITERSMKYADLVMGRQT